MKRDLSASPQQLAGLICAGSVLAVIGFITLGKSTGSLPSLLTSAALMLLGVGLLFWTPYQLREGVQNQRWPAEQIDPFRRIVEHTAWTAMTFVLLVGMLFAFVLGRPHHRSYYWMFFLALQTMTQISGAFRAPYRPPSTPARVDWTQVQPLHSDHWGER